MLRIWVMEVIAITVYMMANQNAMTFRLPTLHVLMALENGSTKNLHMMIERVE